MLTRLTRSASGVWGRLVSRRSRLVCFGTVRIGWRIQATGMIDQTGQFLSKVKRERVGMRSCYFSSSLLVVGDHHGQQILEIELAVLAQLLREDVSHYEERVGQLGLQVFGQVELLLLAVEIEHLEVLFDGQDGLSDIGDAILSRGRRFQVKLSLHADLVIPFANQKSQ